MTEKKTMTRKDFLKTMGTAVAGVAVVGSMSGLLTGCSDENAQLQTSSESPKWPFKYKKIDPAVAEARAYNAYFEKGG